MAAMATHVEPTKEPVTPLAGPYGHPLHPILVTVPIGAWLASLVFDIGSRIVKNPGFLYQGSQWLIAIGVIGALVAAIFGLLDLLTIPRGTPALRIGLLHMALNITVLVAYVINFIWRRSGYDHPAAVGVGPLVLSIVSLAFLGVSGFLGGKLTYHYGVRVAREADQAEGYRSSSTR
jgi:uncharacterized membrane protein